MTYIKNRKINLFSNINISIFIFGGYFLSTKYLIGDFMLDY